MTSAEYEAATEELRRIIRKLGDHAVAYKELFHSMQDEACAAMDEVTRRGEVIKEQRRIIGALEGLLGIDREL